MTTYAHTAAVIDRLIDELGQPEVQSVRFEGGIVYLRLDEPVGLPFHEHRLMDGYFYSTDIIREDVQIHVTSIVLDDQEAAA